MVEALNTTVSRRSARAFVEEEVSGMAVGQTGVMALESQSSSKCGDMEKGQYQREARSSSTSSVETLVLMVPRVDPGKDIHNMFPSSVEDMGKQGKSAYEL
jgi:hypothetical protein